MSNKYGSVRIEKVSLIENSMLRVRNKVYEYLKRKIPLDKINTVLDVGVTPEREFSSANFFEQYYPHPERITALSNEDASWMEDEFVGLKFVHGDGCNMPFNDNSFDLVFSSAVIEHVGNGKRQKDFITECLRVSDKYVFFTTPNRWYPIEFHTVLPFLHWLPPKIFRRILKSIKQDFLADENNLNLMSKNDMKLILNDIPHINYEISTIKLLGLPSHLLILICK